jgi:cathepsin A (carboxypeptidase C)
MTKGPLEETLCYPVTKHIAEYLNRPETRKLLGVSQTLDNMTFSSCNEAVGAAFIASMDGVHVQVE